MSHCFSNLDHCGGTSLGAFTHLGRGVGVQKNAPGAFGAFGHILNCSLHGCICAFYPKLVVNYFAPWCKWCIWAFFGTLFSSTQKSRETRKNLPISYTMLKRCMEILKNHHFVRTLLKIMVWQTWCIYFKISGILKMHLGAFVHLGMIFTRLLKNEKSTRLKMVHLEHLCRKFGSEKMHLVHLVHLGRGAEFRQYFQKCSKWGPPPEYTVYWLKMMHLEHFAQKQHVEKMHLVHLVHLGKEVEFRKYFQKCSKWAPPRVSTGLLGCA